LLAVAVALCAAACVRPSVHDDPPNILLISIDALRADHLSSYGYDRLTSPGLDALAARGTRFSYAFANTHGTPPSHTTLLSSTYQETHRVGFGNAETKRGNYAIPDEVELVQEILQRSGWHTVAVTGGGYMSADFGYERGFDFFSDRARGVEEGARTLAEKLVSSGQSQRPVFALLHTYQVHSPYTPPEGFDRLFGEYSGSIEPTNEALIAVQGEAGRRLDRSDFDYLESLYDGEIRYTDGVLDHLFTELGSEGFLENTVVIVTSDHGEEFGDHGGLLHGGKLFDELLRVPLIISGGGIAAGVVEPALVSFVDIAPTILSIAGLPIPDTMEGRNLFDRSRSMGWAEQKIFAQYGDQLYCLRTPRWKLIHRPGNNGLRLFDLRRDPGERRNVHSRHPELALRMLDELETWRNSRPRLDLAPDLKEELSTEKIEELRALGYVD
jgi:arylsulfatase A-like enzyme